MKESRSHEFTTEVAEIEHLIGKFKEKFASATTDADDFMTITELELMWGELQQRTNNIYADMIRKLMSEVDESDLIRKKKLLQATRCEP
jgi:hypothetical protein